MGLGGVGGVFVGPTTVVRGGVLTGRAGTCEECFGPFLRGGYCPGSCDTFTVRSCSVLLILLGGRRRLGDFAVPPFGRVVTIRLIQFVVLVRLAWL